MTYYGHTTFKGLFSVSKQMLQSPGSYRFGGSHAQVAFKASDWSPVAVTLHHSGVNVIQADEDTISVALIGVKKEVNAVFSDITLVDVSDSYTVPSDRHAVLLDGQLTVDGSVINAENDLHKLDPNTLVTGSGKLLVFNFLQE